MIDTHVHLYDKRYDEDLGELITSAINKGIKHCVVVACGLKEIELTIELAKKYPDFISYSFGFHPVDVSNLKEEDLNTLENYIKEYNPVAVGEIGLDYHWHPEETELQKFYLLEQIKLAKKYDLPLIIHNRNSTEDIYEILKSTAPHRGVIHSFSEDSEYANKFIELGFYIGLSGPTTFKNGLQQKDCAANVDLNKLLLETDGPYLTPEPFRGKRNKPEYVEYIASEIAFQKSISVDEVKKATTKNAVELFNLELNV